MPWRTIEGKRWRPLRCRKLQVVLQGLLDTAPIARFHPLLRCLRGRRRRHPDQEDRRVPPVSTRVNRALAETLKATDETGDRRVGVVWHTQGSGKSLTMAFYAGRLVLETELQNPTIVMLTDRNDLDDQLYGTFSRLPTNLLRQDPVQAEDREHLRSLLQVCRAAWSSLRFRSSCQPRATAIRAFRPAQHYCDGRRGPSQPVRLYRRLRPAHAGCPSRTHRSSASPVLPHRESRRKYPCGLWRLHQRVRIQRAVEDKATVPIYYESRLAKLQLDERERPKIDPSFEEVTEGEEVERRERLRTKWAALEAVVGTEEAAEDDCGRPRRAL